MTTSENAMTGVFCWNELMTPNPQKALSFYTQLLGWTTQTHNVGEMTYNVFISDGKAIGGMLQTPKEKEACVPAHWMSYIGVENAEETLEKALSLGATLIMPITLVPGKGRFFLITDPTGAHIAFWQNIAG